MGENKTGYILFYEYDDYVESFDLGNKSVTTSPVRKDAQLFHNRGETEYIAEILGCKVKNV